METLRIEIINPKVKKLLKNLADLNLISIDKSFDSTVEFKEIVVKLRSNSDIAPSIEEITSEVEEVRALRYAQKTK